MQLRPSYLLRVVRWCSEGDIHICKRWGARARLAGGSLHPMQLGRRSRGRGVLGNVRILLRRWPIANRTRS